MALAEVARPHGVRGELRLKVYNPDSELLLQRPALRVVMADGDVRPTKVMAVRRVPGALLVRLDGVNDRDEAELLRGARFEVLRDALADTDDDEYYHVDLEGCRVYLEGEELGVVLHVASYPTLDALVIDRSSAGRIEVPLHASYVGSVDVDQQRIELNTIDGLE